MNRRYVALPDSRALASFLPVILMVGLLLLVLAAGCGKKDQNEPEDQAQVDRPHSLVPSNLDSLIAETGTSLVPQEILDEPTGQPLEIMKVEGTVEDKQPAAKVVAPAAKSRAVPAANGAYSLQVGSFRQEANAATLAQKVQDLGYSSSVEMAEVGGLMYHRVFVRGLGGRDEAEKLGEELRTGLGINYLVLRNQ